MNFTSAVLQLLEAEVDSSKKVKRTREELKNENIAAANKLIDELELDSANLKIIAVVPGSFKPPHAGHFGMVAEYAKMSDKVVVMIANLERASDSGIKISTAQSRAIWEVYKKYIPEKNVVICESELSPVGVVHELCKNEKLSGKTLILGVSSKDGEGRYKSCISSSGPNEAGVVIKIGATESLRSGDKPVSATDMRNALGDREKLVAFLPSELQDVTNSEVSKDRDKVLDILS